MWEVQGNLRVIPTHLSKYLYSSFRITLFSTRAWTQYTQRGCACSLLCSYVVLIIWSWAWFSTQTFLQVQEMMIFYNSECESTLHLPPVSLPNQPHIRIWVAACHWLSPPHIPLPVRSSLPFDWWVDQSNYLLSRANPDTGYLSHSTRESRMGDIELHENNLFENVSQVAKMINRRMASRRMKRQHKNVLSNGPLLWTSSDHIGLSGKSYEVCIHTVHPKVKGENHLFTSSFDQWWAHKG